MITEIKNEIIGNKIEIFSQRLKKKKSCNEKQK